jgi:hypothetical protein
MRCAPPPRLAASLARVVDEHAPHHLGGDAEELGTVTPLHAPLIDQSQVGFVYQRRRLQRVLVPLVPHRAGCLPVQLLVDGRDQAIGCGPLAAAPREQERGDVG